MSIVGTRPPLISETNLYEPRHKVSFLVIEIPWESSALYKYYFQRKSMIYFIGQGALWNGGVFAYKLKYVLNKAHELIEFSDYYDLYSKYETLPKISFDYRKTFFPSTA